MNDEIEKVEYINIYDMKVKDLICELRKQKECRLYVNGKPAHQLQIKQGEINIECEK